MKTTPHYIPFAARRLAAAACTLVAALTAFAYKEVPPPDKVVLPIAPRPQRIELTWREPAGVTALLRSPPVDLGVPSVNAHLHVAMPANRWILFAGGLRLGPAVLFWSLIPVILLISIGLGDDVCPPETAFDLLKVLGGPVEYNAWPRSS